MKRVVKVITEEFLYDDNGNLIKESRREQTDTFWECQSAENLIKIPAGAPNTPEVEAPTPILNKKVIKPVKRNLIKNDLIKEDTEVVPVQEVEVLPKESFLTRFTREHLNKNPEVPNLIKIPASEPTQVLIKNAGDEVSAVMYQDISNMLLHIS